MNISSKVYNLRRLNSENMMGLVSAKSIPSMNVQIAPISFWTSNGKYVEYEGGISPDIIPQLTMARWTVVCLTEVNNICYIRIVNGTESTNPALPNIPKTYLPLAAIYLNNATTVITNDIIYDVRNFVSMNNNALYHNNLLEPNQPNMHTIEAITNLRDELDNKLNSTDLNSVLVNKADVDGTQNSSWTLNKNNTGIASGDVEIIVNRGAEPDVAIKWNEELSQWQFTNDGINWIDFGFNISTATTLINGVVKLSVEGTEVAVADNDPRILDITNKANITDVYTKTETDTLLTDKANVTDVYTKTETDILLTNSVTVTYLSTELDLKADKANTYNKTEVDTALSYKASTLDISSYVDSRINSIIDAAPSSLDTLNEIASALNNDANLATTLTNQISNKANVTTVEALSTEVNLKANVTDVYTKTETDTLLTDKANVLDVYTKTETDTLLTDKANVLDVYTKTEIDTSLLTPKTIYVDKNRIDEYISNGTMTKPFKTVQEAFTAIAGLVSERIVIDIAPGVYEETFALTINGSSIRINLNESLLKGEFTLTDATNDLALQNKAGLKIVGIGARSSYNDPNFTNNCIQGNFTYYTLAANNMQTRLDFVNSGVIGNVTAIGSGGNRLWTFWTNSRWSGLMSATTGVNDCGIIVNAYNSNSSGSNSIGAASGKVAAYNLYNCVISGAWNVNISQPGTWRNVIWKSNNDFTGYTGTIDIDSNSAASFLSKSTNISGLTLTFADKANTIAYNPTNAADWATQPTTIGEAIDKIAAALAILKGSSI